MAESLPPGVVVSELARRHDLLPQQLFAWRHEARQGRVVLPAEALSFVPVSPDQLAALFERLDWKRVHSRRLVRPQLAQ